MARKSYVAITVALLVPGMWAQTVDEIIAKNIQARGGMDKLKSVQTVKSTATMAMGRAWRRRGC